MLAARFPRAGIEGQHRGCGHAKGVVMWNENWVGWLVHSAAAAKKGLL